jgi:flagellar hook-associated protein 2
VEFGGTLPGTGLLITSPDNKFDNVIPGVELTVLAPSEDNVSVEVAQDQEKIVTAVEEFVAAYNSIRANLDEVTAFNEEDVTTGVLFGTTAVLRVESDLNRLLSGRFFGVGELTSLEALGLGFSDKGEIEFDSSKLTELLIENPAAVERFFTHETLGLAAKLKSLIEQLAGEDESVLASRSETLADIIKTTSDRVTSMNERLARERERLLTEFARLESVVAEMQSSLTALANMQIIPPLTTTRSRSSLIG